MRVHLRNRFLVTTALVSAGIGAAVPATAQDYGYVNDSGTIQSLANPLGATITGVRGGVFAHTGGIILTNAGTVRGNGTYDGFDRAPDGGVVISQAGSSVDNNGTISGAGTGITTIHYLNPVTNLLEPRAVGTTVTNSGTITGDINDGVRLIGGGTVTNSGTIRGLVGAGADGVSMFALQGQDTTGLTSIGSVANLALGTISGQRFGIILSGGGLVENAGAISGNTGAVLIQEGFEIGKTATITNSGALTGGTAVKIGGLITSATVTNSGTLKGTGAYGINNDAPASLTVTNAAGGVIEGAKSGIFGKEGAVVVNNAGTIIGRGTYDGFDAEPDSAIILAVEGSSVVNSGTITGAGTGVGTSNYYDAATASLVPRAVGTSVTNSGTITGQNNDGVRLIGGGTVTNSGTIRGQVAVGADGISMFALRGQDTTGLVAIGSVANLAAGTISGQRFGIILSGGGAIENAGAISGNTGGILIQAQGSEVGKTATVSNSGTLTGGDAVKIGGLITSATVTNSGSLVGTAAFGIHNISAGPLSVSNLAGGSIAGAKSGIFAEAGAVTLTNAGTIRGNGAFDGLAAAPDAGILIAAGNSSVANSGTISGAGFGISTAHYFNPATSSLEPRAVGIAVTNSGTIIGESNDGVRLIGGGTVTNSGTIQGQIGVGADGVSMFALTGQDTAGQAAIGGIVNLAGGTISGQRFGVILSGGGAITNAGTIEGVLGSIRIQAQGTEIGKTATITNSGTLIGDLSAGPNLASSFLVNSGTIAGAVSLSRGNDRLENEGRIDGAVSLGLGDDSLTLMTGSQVAGVIDGGDGIDTVSLRGSSAVATVAQTIAELANFERLNVEQGYWTAAGPVGTFGQVSIGADATLAVRELVTAAGSISPLVTGSIVNNGLFVLDFDNTDMFDDIGALSISGSGGVRLEGEGIFTVDGVGLTYTGVTSVANGGLVLTGMLGGDVTTSGDGVFQLGDGGTTGEFAGDLINNGSFIFNRSDDYAFLGDFSGTGDFAKMGAGTLTFAGDYGYTGTTRILGGTVRFTGQIDPTTELNLQSGNFDISGAPQTVAELAGASGTNVVLDDSILTVNQDSNTAYAGVIAGDGSLVKEGDGRLNLTGASIYTGATVVNGGILSVNGSIVSDVTVSAGGTLGGTGTVADVTVGTGGAFAPGNSIGTITVAGNIVFAAGSSFDVEVNAAGAADRINATGSATIAQGAGVNVLAETGTYRPRTDYTILTAAGGVGGTFSSVTSNMAFLTPILAYGANAITLRLYRNDILFADVATSSNQANTGSAVQALGIGNPLFEDALIQDEAGARGAFDALSGEIHASVQSALTNDSRHVRDALLGATRTGEGMGVWGSAIGSWGEADGDDGVATLETGHRALMTGFTFGGANFVAGVAAGLGNADYDANALGSTADVDSKYLGAHLGYEAGRLSMKGGLAMGWHDVDTSRSVSFATINQSPEASYDASTRQVFGEVAYAFDISSVRLAPFARLAHVRTKTDGFAEATGSAALTVDGNLQKVGLSNLGVHARGAAGAKFQPRLSLSWQHGWGDLGGVSSARFAGATADFSVLGSRLPRNALAVDAGLDAALGRARLGVSYIGSVSDAWSDHGAKATLSVKF